MRSRTPAGRRWSNAFNRLQNTSDAPGFIAHVG
jgi:hypothetical protein